MDQDMGYMDAATALTAKLKVGKQQVSDNTLRIDAVMDVSDTARASLDDVDEPED
jgi:hypothetical protein